MKLQTINNFARLVYGIGNSNVMRGIDGMAPGSAIGAYGDSFASFTRSAHSLFNLVYFNAVFPHSKNDIVTKLDAALQLPAAEAVLKAELSGDVYANAYGLGGQTAWVPFMGEQDFSEGSRKLPPIPDIRDYKRAAKLCVATREAYLQAKQTEDEATIEAARKEMGDARQALWDMLPKACHEAVLRNFPRREMADAIDLSFMPDLMDMQAEPGAPNAAHPPAHDYLLAQLWPKGAPPPSGELISEDGKHVSDEAKRYILASHLTNLRGFSWDFLAKDHHGVRELFEQTDLATVWDERGNPSDRQTVRTLIGPEVERTTQQLMAHQLDRLIDRFASISLPLADEVQTNTDGTPGRKMDKYGHPIPTGEEVIRYFSTDLHDRHLFYGFVGEVSGGVRLSHGMEAFLAAMDEACNEAGLDAGFCEVDLSRLQQKEHAAHSKYPNLATFRLISQTMLGSFIKADDMHHILALIDEVGAAIDAPQTVKPDSRAVKSLISIAMLNPALQMFEQDITTLKDRVFRFPDGSIKTPALALHDLGQALDAISPPDNHVEIAALLQKNAPFIGFVHDLMQHHIPPQHRHMATEGLRVIAREYSVALDAPRLHSPHQMLADITGQRDIVQEAIRFITRSLSQQNDTAADMQLIDIAQLERPKIYMDVLSGLHNHVLTLENSQPLVRALEKMMFPAQKGPRALNQSDILALNRLCDSPEEYGLNNETLQYALQSLRREISKLPATGVEHTGRG
jgi:hypothetical protein